jgi:hypothetical protein
VVFGVGDTAAPRLSELHRVQLLGQCTDLDTIPWTISPIRQLTSFAEHGPWCKPSPTHRSGGYTSCLDLPGMRDIPFFPLEWAFAPPSMPPPAPTPLLWTPKYQPEQWVFTDGSNIKGQPRLGAAVVHVPTCTTIYIDAGGTRETCTIMRAELAPIYTALANFDTHDWVGIFKSAGEDVSPRTPNPVFSELIPYIPVHKTPFTARGCRQQKTRP